MRALSEADFGMRGFRMIISLRRGGRSKPSGSRAGVSPGELIDDTFQQQPRGAGEDRGLAGLVAERQAQASRAGANADIGLPQAASGLSSRLGPG